MLQADLNRVHELAERMCGSGIVVKGPEFEANTIVVFRRKVPAGLKEIVRFSDRLIADARWDEIQEKLREACP